MAGDREAARIEGDGGKPVEDRIPETWQLLTLQLDLGVGVIETPVLCHSAGGLQVG